VQQDAKPKGKNPQYNPTKRFLLRLCKNQIFHPKGGSVVVLSVLIDNAVASVRLQMVENLWYKIKFHLDILQATNDTLCCIQLDELFLQAKQTNSLYIVYSVIYVYLIYGEFLLYGKQN
jgi:hypothetical protein